MRTFIRTALFAALTAAAVPAFAQAPPIVPFQGFLTDLEGVPRDGEVVLDIELYDAPVEGNLLAAESLVVDVVDGYFTAELGVTDTLDLALAASGCCVFR